MPKQNSYAEAISCLINAWKRKPWDVKSKNPPPHFMLHIGTRLPPLIIRRGWAAPHTGCLFQHPHYIPILLNARGKYALKMTLNNLGGPQRRRGRLPLAGHFQRRSAAQPDSSGAFPGLLTKPPPRNSSWLAIQTGREPRDHFGITWCDSVFCSAETGNSAARCRRQAAQNKSCLRIWKRQVHLVSLSFHAGSAHLFFFFFYCTAIFFFLKKNPNPCFAALCVCVCVGGN